MRVREVVYKPVSAERVGTVNFNGFRVLGIRIVDNDTAYVFVGQNGDLVVWTLKKVGRSK
jgi:hypothetical protein